MVARHPRREDILGVASMHLAGSQVRSGAVGETAANPAHLVEHSAPCLPSAIPWCHNLRPTTKLLRHGLRDRTVVVDDTAAESVQSAFLRVPHDNADSPVYDQGQFREASAAKADATASRHHQTSSPNSPAADPKLLHSGAAQEAKQRSRTAIRLSSAVSRPDDAHILRHPVAHLHPPGLDLVAVVCPPNAPHV